MLFAQVDKRAREELERVLVTETDSRWQRRLAIIDQSSKLTPVNDLAKQFELCPATIRAYIKQYNTEGLDGLCRDDHMGRPAKITLQKTEIEAVLQQCPTVFKQLNTDACLWTQSLFLTYLRTYHHVYTTQGTVSTTLKRLGICWDEITRPVRLK